MLRSVASQELRCGVRRNAPCRRRCSDIVVAHRKIDAGIAIRVSDRTVRSQSAPNSVRIIAPVWMVVIEVSRPIDDRRAFPHGCLLCGHAAGPLARASPRPDQALVRCPYLARG